MIDRTVVFTVAALDAFLGGRHDSSIHDLRVPEEIADRVTSVETRSATYLIHASDNDASPRVVLAYCDCLDSLPAESLGVALARANRLALNARTPPIRLPTAWSSYTHNNLVAYFAIPREAGALRWIGQIGPARSSDVFLCRVTRPVEPVLLEQFRVPMTEYRAATNEWAEAREQATRRFQHRSRRSTVQVVDTIDLEATTFGAVIGGRTYAAWIEQLTGEQRAFLQRPANQSTKLRGPAGSGKTLLLELKALHETYEHETEASRPRILYVTHSWAMAEQVDAALRHMHDRAGSIDNIAVYPLLSIAQDLLPAERQGRGFELLGEDNLSGKQLQLDLIAQRLDHFVDSDWLAYEDRCSPTLAARVTAAPRSAERKALVWDLMHEFACVLSAHGILPGVNAARHYLPLPRMPWMMELLTEGDKRLVLEIYAGVVAELREQQLLTSDQLINDFLNYLETFAWNLRRTEAGYDLVFVDELHLFNEQERMALNFLSRDADSHPVMFMALDPRQSPAEAYTGGVAASGVDSGEADAALGEVASLELTTVHRFSPEILALVRHLNNSYPALDLGDDWAMDADRLQTSVESTGESPTIASHASREDEVAAVATDIASWTRRAPRSDERIAVVLIDPLALEEFAAIESRVGPVLALRGRDDVDALQYSRRAVVISPAEYVAGLQFARVVVAGFPPFGMRRANLGHERRRLLSLLYLAVSRATTSVSIHVNIDAGGVPDVLESALAQRVLSSAD